MEEPGEQCTVVVALIVPEPASECECMWRGWGGRGCDPPPPLAGSETNYAKTTVHCSPVSSMVVDKSSVVCSVRCEPVKRNKDFPLFEGAIRHVNVQYHVTLRDLLCPRCSLSYPSPPLIWELDAWTKELKDTNPLMSSLLVIFVRDGEAIL